MIIKKLQDVPFAAAPGYEGVKKQVMIGPEDGSNEIVMRYFRLAPGGSTPHHAHDWPHLVKVEVGKGVAVDVDGNQTPIEAGDFITCPTTRCTTSRTRARRRSSSSASFPAAENHKTRIV